MTLAAIDFDGPFSSLANRIDDETSYLFRHCHAWLVNAGIALVALHVMGVVWGSIQHKENLVKAMFTGDKALPPLSESDLEIN